MTVLSSTLTDAQRVTRLAPSPTGALHLGNARTFVITWALARQRGWRCLLRIEDLDGPRVRPGAAEGIMQTLGWLGLDWDGPVLIQSADMTPYVQAMRLLARGPKDAGVSGESGPWLGGLVYPTTRSRQTPADSPASAPQAGAHEARFDASMRPLDWATPREFVHGGGATSEAAAAWRFAVPDDGSALVQFVDQFAGPQAIDPSRSVGDFVVWTKQGVPAYQLAVVIDDARQPWGAAGGSDAGRGVTDVIRGDDLLDSAARQQLLIAALRRVGEPHVLGASPHPIRYTHLPLVLGPDGRRLAKRHGDTRVDRFRALGVPVERLIGLLA
ncbi:MAG: glutamate--tRNA ligase family protein, partial [Phycisphaerales bacterium]|nr:glutamate--tRNA ligase family protein [Phycisphaerales bacterium]